ncbi:MAG: quinoprotein relay system zinc metallohydrolase 2 [Bradyrhizobiaceae bacterium]|nr:MAG: quinoprotein relay system zinc metallohydrolase 2 [Bradyrhizobiaceae bacterium]
MVAAVIVIVIASPALAHAQERALPVQEIAAGVFVHEGRIALASSDNDGAIANIGFIIGTQAVAVIDTGGSVREGRRLLAAIRARTGAPIRYVINTHGHPDHMFGNAAFVADGVQFVGHHRLPQAMATRGPFYLDSFRRIMGDALLNDVRIVPPTLLVNGSLALDLGERTVIIQAWPVAHSDNDVTVFDQDSKTLFAGDLVFIRHIPVLDGSIKNWLGILDDLAALPARRVVPGHGPVSDWPGALADERRYLGTLATDIRRDVVGGRPIRQAAEQAAASERQRWQLFEDYNIRNATAAYSQFEWE